MFLFTIFYAFCFLHFSRLSVYEGEWRRWRKEEKKLNNESALLETIYLRDLMVYFLKNKSNGFDFKVNEVYGGPLIILIHLRHLRLINWWKGPNCVKKINLKYQNGTNLNYGTKMILIK